MMGVELGMWSESNKPGQYRENQGDCTLLEMAAMFPFSYYEEEEQKLGLPPWKPKVK